MAIFFMILCILGAMTSVFKCLDEAVNHKFGTALIWALLFLLNTLGSLAWYHQSRINPDNKQYQYQTIVTKTLITTNDTVLIQSDTTYTYTE